MTKILAIDTSTDACSAALLFDHQLIDCFRIAPKQHTDFILPMVNDLLVQAELDLSQLDAIAFGSGPGSFTGVRLAASVAQGLAFAANVPVVKISTLRALAQEVFAEFRASRVMVAQDARMQEVYWGEYQADSVSIMQAIKPDQLIRPIETEEIADMNLVGAGSGFEVYRDVLIKRCSIKIVDKQYVQAKYVVQLAEADFARGVFVKPEDALPTYLRDRVTWTSSPNVSIGDPVI